MTDDERRLSVLRSWFEPSPYFELTEAAGATTYGVYNRTYWPSSFGRDPRLEFDAVMRDAVLIDVGCQRVVEIRGARALEVADYLCARDLSSLPIGRARHTAVCEPNGTLYCEAIVLRPAEDVVWLGHGPVDFLQWARAIAAHTHPDVTVERPPIFPFALQGPASRPILGRLVPEVQELPFFGWVQGTLGGRPASSFGAAGQGRSALRSTRSTCREPSQPGGPSPLPRARVSW